MKVIATNLGERKIVDWKGKKVETGIFKYPVNKPIYLEVENVKDDAICDRKYHGGINQAAYGYSLKHYDHFKPLFPEADWELGMFGENLTFDDLDETTIHTGDQFQLGETIVEATTYREPCKKLGIRFNDMKVVKEFWKTSYSGVYFKVLKKGYVKVGDELIAIKKLPENKTIADLYEENK